MSLCFYLRRAGSTSVLSLVLTRLCPHQVSLSHTVTHRRQPVSHSLVPHPDTHEQATIKNYSEDLAI